MRVLILSQYYKPEPIFKPSELAIALHQRGHQVWVLTGFPNYPSGKLDPRYRLRLLHKEELDGIPVTRAFEFPYHGKSVALRIANYASVMLSTPPGSLSIPRCDVAYVYHPPLSIGVSAWLVKLLRGTPFVYDVLDIWPESAVASGLLRKGLFVSAMAMLEKFVYRRAGHILVPTDDGRDNLIAKGVPRSRVSVVPQWVDETLFVRTSSANRNAVRESLGWSGRFVVLFAGNIGLVQGLETVLKAARELTDAPTVLIVLMGDGSDKTRLVEMATAMGLGSNIEFIGHQPVERMPEYMGAADVLLAHLQASQLCKFVIPLKILAYLAVGRPILMAVGGAAAQVADEAGAGITVPSENPMRLAEAVRYLQALSPERLEEMGNRGRLFFRDHYARAKVVERYIEILQGTATQR